MISQRILHLTQIICASLWCLLASGIIFGFAALKPVLVQEGVYSELCISTTNSTTIEPCLEQDLKLNSMFTISAAFTNIMALPVGWILDTFGPKICGVIGSLILSIGSLFFIFASNLIYYMDPYRIGYILLAVSGPFVFISCFQLANCFPKRSGTILAVLTGSFDTSSALFLGYKIMYNKSNYSFSLRKFFTIYLLVPSFIFICQMTIMPHESYKSLGTVTKLGVEGLDENGNLLEGDDGSTIFPNKLERQPLISQNSTVYSEEGNDSYNELPQLGRRKSALENYVEGRLEEKSGGVFGILHDRTAVEQIKSPWFLLMLIFAAVLMIRINYFIATIRSQENYLLGDEKLSLKINAIFDVLLPIGGVIAIPFIGIILDHHQTIHVLYFLFTITTLISVLGLFSNYFTLNLLGICLLVLYRPFYYTVVSDYCSKVFGFTTFGTVYGLLTCVCGIFTFLQSYLDELTHTVFRMNPTPVNVTLLFLTVTSGPALLVYIKYELKKKKQLQNISSPESEGTQERTA